jgi:hypothetical protein
VFQITGGDNERQELTNWNVTEVTASYIKLEVKFANPLEISAFGVTNQDKLEVLVKIPILFESEATGEYIPHSTFIQAKLPAQLPSDSAAFETMMVLTDASLKLSLISTVVALVAEGALSEVWGAINAMQLLAQIYHMKLYLPSNAQAFFMWLSSISEFTLYDMTPVYKSLFGWIFILDQEYVLTDEEEYFEDETDEERRLAQQKRAKSRTKTDAEEKEEKLESELF